MSGPETHVTFYFDIFFSPLAHAYHFIEGSLGSPIRRGKNSNFVQEWFQERSFMLAEAIVPGHN